MGKSLAAREDPLAQVDTQRSILAPAGTFLPFGETLARHQLGELRAAPLKIIQLNVGKMCNQTCRHCHVDAGPDRTEIMSRSTMADCLRVLDQTDAELVDITGGAPEMNPHFRWLVEEISRRGRRVIDRCNLTILLTPRYEDLPEFLKSHQVEIVASLPYFSSGQTDRQRGDGVFDRSIRALRRLNEIGYGMEGSPLRLNLVFNPAGAFLPPDQWETENTFKQQLASRFGIYFHQLYTITNQPINRFLEYLLQSGNYESYMQRLMAAFNPAAAAGLMCRDTLSVSWEGRLYDCDFNQMLEMEVDSTFPQTIGELADRLDQQNAAMGHREQHLPASRPIRTGLHCYACTAGAGSSCGGTTTK